jgi:hypothetical protein
MTNLKWLASASLAIVTFPATYAEPHCPGNVNSLRLRLVQRSLIVVPVEINHTGPYDFMVDTGSQITTVDPALASALHLKILGEAGFIGVGHYTHPPLTRLDSVQAGSNAVDAVLAVIQNPGQVQASDARVRGILGSNFLEHFDVLIDYPRGLLCLDEGKFMQASLRGEHIALANPADSERNLPFTEPPIVPVNVTGVKGQLLMQLDSGCNAPMLYEAGKELTHALFVGAPLRTRGADGIEREFTLLPPQDLQVGGQVLHRIPFVVPRNPGRDVPKLEIDGLLPTVLFQRVYISFADHYVMLVPW